MKRIIITVGGLVTPQAPAGDSISVEGVWGQAEIASALIDVARQVMQPVCMAEQQAMALASMAREQGAGMFGAEPPSTPND